MRRRVEHGQLGREFSLMCSIVICLRSQTHAAGLGRAMSRGLISNDDLTVKLARLRNRIAEASRAFDHSG